MPIRGQENGKEERQGEDRKRERRIGRENEDRQESERGGKRVRVWQTKVRII